MLAAFDRRRYSETMTLLNTRYHCCGGIHLISNAKRKVLRHSFYIDVIGNLECGSD